MKTRVLIVLFALIATPVSAQYWTYNPAASQAIMADVQHQALMTSMRSSQSNDRSSIPENIDSISLNYIQSTARTRKNLANFVTKTRAADPAGAAQLEQLFASTDIIDAMGKAIAPYGLKTNDVSHVFAVYWVNAWEASRGLVGTTETQARIQAVAAQAASGLAASPGFAQANDAQKQEMAEALLIQAALISAHMESAAGNPAQLQAVAQAVRQGARATGLDLDEMTLTPTGFQPVARK